jgi:hypothetical protein
MSRARQSLTPRDVLACLAVLSTAISLLVCIWLYLPPPLAVLVTSLLLLIALLA